MSIRYRLTVTRVEPDPNFASKMEEFEKSNRFGRHMNEYDVPGRPQEDIKTNVLIVELSEIQFTKVKAEVIKTFQ